MPVEGSLRDRRRAQTVREIKDATLAQLAEAGPGALSLRAVARSVGMTVQSIYHYFDSRDALLTALVADAHHGLADAVQAAAEATRGRPPAERRLAASVAYREWAITNRAGFLLLYGTPVPGFEPLPDGGTREAALRLATPFLDVVFDGWTAAELTAVPVGRGGEPLAEVTHPAIPLPAGALALFTELRARMHGLVMLELLGHLRPLHGHAPVLYTAAMNRMSDDIDELRRRAAQASFSAR
ncbi:MAG TPA: TetR/AcrR family transcriptional regulator [Pseudonocardia sp.]|nr:TetR/AcrR family transcriptional regulator [Pseudonocardia sp.]